MNKNKLNINQGKVSQRFSIRKLSIGAASVLIGLTFFGVNTEQVNADAVATAPKNELVETKAEPKAEEKTEEQADQQKAVVNNHEPAETSDQDLDTDITPATVDKNKQKAVNQELIAVPRHTTENQDNGIVADKNNTPAGIHVNDNKGLTNVPKDGSIQYNYSVTAKNKKTGQQEKVTIGEGTKENKAVIDTSKAYPIEAHFSLTNTSDQDKFIGNDEWGTNRDPNKHNDDEAQLYINAWDNGNHTLKINALKPANVVFEQNGNVINNNALPVYYCGSDNHWYTYDGMVEHFGKSSIYQVRKIGFKGIIPGKTTARMDVPLIVDTAAATLTNNIGSLGVKTPNIKVYTATKIWDKDEVANSPFHLVEKNNDGSYTEISDYNEIATHLPKVGEVVQIPDEFGGIDFDNQQGFYIGGSYELLLDRIQQAVSQYGYTVDVAANNDTIWNHYTYSSTGGLIVKKPDSNQSALPPAGSNQRYFYVEVHKVLTSQDQTVEEGSSAANTVTSHVITEVTDVKNVNNRLTNLPGKPQNVKLVSIVDENNHSIAKIDSTTPAGKYKVTYEYELNGSTNPKMLIKKTAFITITAKPHQPVQPTAPTNPTNPTTPTQPTSPVQPSGPVTPVEPVQPSAPVQPSSTNNDNNNVSPLPEDNGENVTSKGENVTPKGQDVDQSNPQGNETVAPKGQKVDRTEGNKRAAQKPEVRKLNNVKANTNSTKRAKLLATDNKVTNSNSTKETATLPQTGEKENKAGIIGLALVAVAGLFGLGLKRKKN